MRWRRKPATQDWWRVQAVWTVDGERRTYDRIFRDGRAAADQAVEETAATLSDFPTLEILLARATANEVEAARVESERLAAMPPEPLHLMDKTDSRIRRAGQRGTESP